MSDQQFTDIHTHIIFSVDDGAKDLDHSLRMVEQAAENGVGQILATPHITDVMGEQNGEKIRKHFNELSEKVLKDKLPIRIYLGSELYFNDRIYDWLHQDWSSFNNNQKYLLFELPLFDLPEGVADFIFNVKLKGITPILAHPERYIYFHKKFDVILNWYQQGCLMQMNAGSLTGQFGDEVSTFTRKLLEAGVYSFVASDAHDTEGRNFKVLGKAYEIANDILAKEQVDKLFIENPARSIRGELIEQNTIVQEFLEKNWIKELVTKIKNFRLK